MQTQTTTRRTLGADLTTGMIVDLIGGRDTIASFADYTGPLNWGPGVTRIATFARGRQMTIPADQAFDVVAA